MSHSARYVIHFSILNSIINKDKINYSFTKIAPMFQMYRKLISLNTSIESSPIRQLMIGSQE